MGDLLSGVLEAHGGLAKWASVAEVAAELDVDGPFWDWRGWPSIRRTQKMTLTPERQHLTLTPFTGEGTTMTWEPGLVTIGDAAGVVPVFPAYHDAVPWDEVQLAAFMATANWAYFTEPFLFTCPGVTAQEVEPWREGGETWRRLAVTFPASLPNHNPDQVFYYGDDLLLRRMDYAPVVTGSSPIAHYVGEPVNVDGLVFYGRRDVHVRDEHGVADKGITPITIRVGNVSWRSAA